ncbi:MAG: dTDP-4-dehydrorhamnose 3,5-epimerase family protein [Planctomycetota bacterium]
MIDGVLVKKMQVFHDDRGFLMEVLKEGEPLFKNIKQTTFTEAYPGVIKAFHWHKRQYDLWFFTHGTAQVVLYDLRKESPTHKTTNVFYMGESNPLLLSIPPGVAHGYRVLGTKPAALFYHTTEAYNPQDPDEERINHDDPGIGFNWTTKAR